MTTKLTTWRLPGYGINGSAPGNIQGWTNSVSIIAADPTFTTFALNCPAPTCDGSPATVTIGAYAQATPAPGDGVFAIIYPSIPTNLYVPNQPSPTVTGYYSVNCDIVDQTVVEICTRTGSYSIPSATDTAIADPNFVITMSEPHYEGYDLGEALFLITAGLEKLPATAEALPTDYTFSSDSAEETRREKYSSGVFYGSTVPGVPTATAAGAHKSAAGRMGLRWGVVGVMALLAGLVLLQ